MRKQNLSNFRMYCEGEMRVWNDYGTRAEFETRRGSNVILR